MAADKLQEVLEVLRREMPDVPVEVWARIERLASLHFPAREVYIPARRKKAHLEALAAAAGEEDSRRLSAMLKVSVRRVQQLKRLK